MLKLNCKKLTDEANFEFKKELRLKSHDHLALTKQEIDATRSIADLKSSTAAQPSKMLGPIFSDFEKQVLNVGKARATSELLPSEISIRFSLYRLRVKALPKLPTNLEDIVIVGSWALTGIEQTL